MAWYDDTHITQGFKWSWANPQGHSGIDLKADFHTPLTSAVSGTVIGAQYRDWGGQVDIRFSLNGEPFVLTYVHLDVIDSRVQIGEPIVAGTLIGLSGGQITGGAHPAGKYSRGPHLHFELTRGEKAPYERQGYEPYRPDAAHYPMDPTNFWKALADHGIANDQSGLAAGMQDAGKHGGLAVLGNTVDVGQPSAGPTGGQQTRAILQELPGFAGIVTALDRAEAFTPFKPPDTSGVFGIPNPGAVAATPGYVFGWLYQNGMAITTRAIFIIFGFLLLLGLLIALVRAQAMSALDTAAKVAPLAAAVA